VPLTEPVSRANANAEAERRIGEQTGRIGLEWRAFLQSLCGAATTFLTLYGAFAALGTVGGTSAYPRRASFEPAGAAEAIAGNDFIFDVQTHRVDPGGTCRSSAGKYWEHILASFPHGS
jgi:uncharacterized protein